MKCTGLTQTALKHIFRPVEKSEYKHRTDGITASVLILSGINNIMTKWRKSFQEMHAQELRGQGPKHR